METKSPNKTDAGNGSYGICRVINASRSPSPDPRRSAEMTNEAPTRAFKSKRRILHILVALLGCIVAWHFLGDGIMEFIDRQMVRNVKYDGGKIDLLPSQRLDSRNQLDLPQGKWVKAGPEVICYGRALSHHTLLGLRSGYSYIQVNGKVYYKAEGPCSSTIHIRLEVDALDNESAVTEEVVIRALTNSGFSLIH